VNAPLRPLALAAAVASAAVELPRAAAAQSYVPQPHLYLLTTDVFDGRALWVQPAGLGKRQEASVSLMATADHDTSGTALGQYGVTLASGGVGVGWQHDRMPGGAHGDAFVVGYAGGTPLLSAGFDHRWHRGTNTKDGAWDVGARYSPSTLLELSLVWRDIGSPVVAGDTIRSTVVPGAAVRLLRGRLRFGADWEIVKSGWGTSALRAGAAVILPANLVLTLRSEFNSHFTTRSIAMGLSWSGTRSRVTGFGASVRGAADHVGAWGSMVADAAAPPRRRFGR
jgi:hypothetical protein